MKVLVLGGGGREHVLSWKLAQSRRVREVWCAPGNGGIARDVRVVPINADTPGGIEEALQFAREREIDLTVVGPEAPLVLGVADRFREAGLSIFGPNRQAARLEGSKCFTKEFLTRHSIPTADFRIFHDPSEARRYVESVNLPVVVKADGLAAGKGVFVARERDEAVEAVEAIMVERRFGDAGSRVLVEDCLEGPEMTLIVLTDGKTALPLETAQDYKPALDGNRGPNTGGMGSYSPHLSLEGPVVREILERVIRPTLAGLEAENILYQGALYAGLMLTADGPRVLEYNVRFGDPEIQPILFRLKTDFLDLIEACLESRLDGLEPEWDPRSAVCVIGASRGYPGSYEKGHPIEGLEKLERDAGGDLKVFVAGARQEEGEPARLVTSGGRVFGVTALGSSLESARSRAYEGIGSLHFTGLTHRGDIGIPHGQ